MNPTLEAEIAKLDLNEKQELFDQLWSDLNAGTIDPIPLTSAQQEELRPRLDAHARDPDDVISLEAFNAALNARR